MFVISKKDVRDKYESFQQAGNIVFTSHSQTCPKYPKKQVCNIFAISKKKQRDDVYFCI